MTSKVIENTIVSDLDSLILVELSTLLNKINIRSRGDILYLKIWLNDGETVKCSITISNPRKQSVVKRNPNLLSLMSNAKLNDRVFYIRHTVRDLVISLGLFKPFTYVANRGRESIFALTE